MSCSHPFFCESGSRVTVSLMVCCTLIAGVGCQMAADGQNLNGVRLYHQGNFNPALQRFQQAVAANPDNANAYYNMAATTHRMGTLQRNDEYLSQAETLYNQCLDLDEDHVECHRGLAVLLVETERPERAFRLLENWARGNPKNAEARIELARLYDEFGDLEAAKSRLNEALDVDHQNPRAWRALGRIREQLKEYDQALANYQRSLQLNQMQPEVAERVAVISRSLRGDAGFSTSGTRTVSTSNRRY